jgi:hypothetical protein
LASFGASLRLFSMIESGPGDAPQNNPDHEITNLDGMFLLRLEAPFSGEIASLSPFSPGWRVDCQRPGNSDAGAGNSGGRDSGNGDSGRPLAFA